jgi:hypothetical protein
MKFYCALFVIAMFSFSLVADESGSRDEMNAYLYYIPYHYQTNVRITKHLIQIIPSLFLALDENEIIKYKKEIDNLADINNKERTQLDKRQIRCYFKIIKNNEIIFDFALTNRPHEGVSVLNIDIKDASKYIDFIDKIIKENAAKLLIFDRALLYNNELLY